MKYQKSMAEMCNGSNLYRHAINTAISHVSLPVASVKGIWGSGDPINEKLKVWWSCHSCNSIIQLEQ